MLIAIEGIDASGKATQARMLAEKLGAKLYSFPNYDSPTGKLIAKHLQGDLYVNEAGSQGVAWKRSTDALVLQALMLANRYELATEIQAELNEGGTVVCDRYWASAYAYGIADGLKGEYLRRVHALLPQPDLHVLLDVDPSISALRRPERRDRYEKDAALLSRARVAYLWLWRVYAKHYPGKWIVLDGTCEIDDLHKRLLWEMGVTAIRPDRFCTKPCLDPLSNPEE